jgi:hypothetical protein
VFAGSVVLNGMNEPRGDERLSTTSPGVVDSRRVAEYEAIQRELARGTGEDPAKRNLRMLAIELNARRTER